jgi:hypothetical protein
MQEKTVTARPVRIYCEHAALTRRIKHLRRIGRIELIKFPYDPGSASRQIPGYATPSGAQIRDLNLPISDLPGMIADYSGSAHFGEILSIVGHQNRRDALHVDSAFKSGCLAFITRDSDILDHKTRLEGILGIRFFDPDTEPNDLEPFVADNSGAY